MYFKRLPCLSLLMLLLVGCGSTVTQERAEAMTLVFFQNYSGTPDLNAAAQLDTDESKFSFQSFNYDDNGNEFTVTGQLNCEGQQGDFSVTWSNDEAGDWSVKTASLSGCEYSAKNASDIMRVSNAQRLAVGLEFYSVDENGYPSLSEGLCLSPDAEPFKAIMETYGYPNRSVDNSYLDYASVLCQGYSYYVSYNDGTEYILVTEVLAPEALLDSVEESTFCGLDVDSSGQFTSFAELEKILIPVEQCPDGERTFYISNKVY